jgi:hypothetical protein
VTRVNIERRIVLLAVCAIAVVATGCGSGATADPLAHKTPAQILQAALAAAEKSGAAHYVLTSVGPAKGQMQTVTGDAGSNDARQTVTGAGARWESLVADDKVFITGDVKGLKDEGFPPSVAATYANKWISIAPTDSPYKTIIGEAALYPALVQLAPIGNLTLTAPTTRDGQQVIGVRGSIRTNSGSTANGTAILYVAIATPTLPVAYSAEAVDDGETATETGTFSSWGEPVQFTVPTESVAFSSISGSG